MKVEGVMGSWDGGYEGLEGMDYQMIVKDARIVFLKLLKFRKL